MQYGTGTGAALVRPAAGKTGTTDDHADAWFAGFTPDLTTVVWVGYPQGEIPMESVHGISVSGGSFPADIWRRCMQRALWSSPRWTGRSRSELPDWEYWSAATTSCRTTRMPSQTRPLPLRRRTSRHRLQPRNPCPATASTRVLTRRLAIVLCRRSPERPPPHILRRAPLTASTRRGPSAP